jgi:hypothetical protein
MKRLQLFAVALTLVALVAGLVAGCYRHSPSEPESRDSISLASIAPPGGTRLSPGTPVTFTAAVDYELRSESFLAGDNGTITMDIENQNGRDLDTQVSKRVAHGQGSTSLSDRIDVPAAGVGQIRVVLTLIPEAVGAPTVVTVAATYPVGP